MFDFKSLFKPKQPKETPEEHARLELATNHIIEFFEEVSCERAKAYIECFCPWVDYDSLSEEDRKRFSKLSIITEGIADGWITAPDGYRPLEQDEFKDLIPDPTPEQIDDYIGWDPETKEFLDTHFG